MMLRLSLLALAAASFVAAQTVTGTVTNSANGQAIRRAYVVLRGIPAVGSATPVETYVSQTGAEGKFSVAEVAPGRYEVEAAHSGFQNRPPNRAAAANYLPQILVEAGQPVAALSLRLTPLGWIAGKVTDDAGDTVIGADVEAMQYRYVQGKKVLQRVGSTQTDDRGEYGFSDLAPGRYYVRAARLEHDPPLYGDVQNRGPGRTRVYTPGYFGGARVAAQASALDVAPGAELARVDIQVRRVSIYAIRGLAPAGSTVNLVRPPGEPSFSYATHVTGENREGFEIDGIPPGTYPVRVSVPQQAGLFAFRRVDVKDQDVEGLDLRRPTGREVSGSIRLDPGTGSASGVHVVLRPEETAAGTGVDGPVQPDGNFSLTGQPDNYVVAVQAPAGVYLQAMRLGDRDIADHRLNPGSQSGKLSLTLAIATGQVDGAVTDAAGGPARLARVTLIPDQRLPFWPDLVRSEVTDTNGRFQFRAVPPGDYTLFAWTDVELGAPEDPEFRKPFESQGVPLRIAAGSAVVSLKAIETAGTP